jgi:hypothetical protein
VKPLHARLCEEGRTAGQRFVGYVGVRLLKP